MSPKVHLIPNFKGDSFGFTIDQKGIKCHVFGRPLIFICLINGQTITIPHKIGHEKTLRGYKSILLWLREGRGDGCGVIGAKDASFCPTASDTH